MTIEQAQNLAREKLSAKRYTHTKNVVEAAKMLARRYGGNLQQAELAAWLHDILKEESREELLRTMSQDAIMAGSTARRPLPVWHGPCAAIFAKHRLGVDDEAVLSAVSCHTTGKVGMNKLDKILFVADIISAERDFPGVEQLRAVAKQGLDEAVVAVMEENIQYVKKSGRPLDDESVRALQDMVGKTKKPDTQV